MCECRAVELVLCAVRPVHANHCEHGWTQLFVTTTTIPRNNATQIRPELEHLADLLYSFAALLADVEMDAIFVE